MDTVGNGLKGQVPEHPEQTKPDALVSATTSRTLIPVAAESTDGLDPISVSLAASEPDPILRAESTSGSDLDEEEIPELRAPSWPVVLLGSYASAVTLACGWLLWERSNAHDLPAPDSSRVDDRPDPGLRADRSRR